MTTIPPPSVPGVLPTETATYIGRMSMPRYRELMERRFPEYAGLLWLDRPGLEAAVTAVGSSSVEFEGAAKGGRGDSYREAQLDPLVRAVGIAGLLGRAGNMRDVVELDRHIRILDVLGGDGTIARGLRTIVKGREGRHMVLTSDIAEDMVARALEYDLPAVRQPAQHLMLRASSFDAVIVASAANPAANTARPDTLVSGRSNTTGTRPTR